ncbi:hypothetical protein QEN19_003407 [Hanseniaspora menglaensis]
MFNSFNNNNNGSAFGNTTGGGLFGQQPQANSFGSGSTNSSALSTLNTGSTTLPLLENEITLENAHTDTITSIFFSPANQMQFVSSAWDGFVRVWDCSSGAINKIAEFQHTGNAPVLNTCYSSDGTKVFSCGVDGVIHVFDLQSQSLQVLATVQSPVHLLKIANIGGMEVLISGSWDNKINYWDIRQFNATTPLSFLQLPEKLFCMDSNAQGILVAACGNKCTYLINLSNPQNIFKVVQSTLKHQPKSIKCFPKNNGFTVASVEGRCSVVYFDENEHKKNGFTFKCHRQNVRTFNPMNLNNSTLGTVPSGYKGAFAYAVNSVLIHPIYGTLATSGSDGVTSFWNAELRHRIKGLQCLNYPISASAFNTQGNLLAYTLSYDWSFGSKGNNQTNPNVIRIHQCTDDEVKEKKKTTGFR